MMVLGAIISAIVAVAGAVLDAAKAGLDILIAFFQTVFTLLQSFVNSAPTPMKIIIFMFFILTIGNLFSNFLLSTQFACNGNNVLYKSDNIAIAMSLMLKTQFQSLSIGDRNTFISNNFQLASTKASPTNVKCVGTQPKLFFYSVDVLNYNVWLLVLVLFLGVPMIWGYYSKMGVLH